MKNKRDIQYSTQYRRDYKKAKKQGKDLVLLRDIVHMLANDTPLSEKHRDHPLSGNWKGYRECHVTPDWLLVYRKTDKDGLVLLLTRIASHSDLDF
ncbi:MAG: type II toxin-antitoxin system YafQ family toxin [Defluviitaleaceae bacterium]|nr:type II toxin-antitoxin system YafQ family toxin [Defluviitaleaceae bacterium]